MSMETIKKIEAYGFECEGGPLENCQDWLKLKDQHERLIWFGEASAASGNPALQKFLDGLGDGLKAERDNLRYQLQTLLHAYRTGNSISTIREAEMREAANLPK